eukprot:m.7446 g.7446  ORF g.7446 m.7446 type:complete len:589 (+) comp5027_c0_seq1:129-1895(+)
MAEPSPGMITPFFVFLLLIAGAPFVIGKFWAKHYHHVSFLFALIIIIYYLAALHKGARLLGALGDYYSFIALIGSLFVIAGGIHIDLRIPPSTRAAVLLLIFGAILANFIGTTGASMLLIRPFINLYKGEMPPHRVVLFIFTVSNAGGMLSPLGDPPLFLGYIKGVPFFWLLRTWQIVGAWATVIVWLLCVYSFIEYIFPRLKYTRRTRPEPNYNPPPNQPALPPYMTSGPTAIPLQEKLMPLQDSTSTDDTLGPVGSSSSETGFLNGSMNRATSSATLLPSTPSSSPSHPPNNTQTTTNTTTTAKSETAYALADPSAEVVALDGDGKYFQSLRVALTPLIYYRLKTRHVFVSGLHNLFWLVLIVMLVLVQESSAVQSMSHTAWAENMGDALHWTADEAAGFIISLIFGSCMAVVAFLSYHFANEEAEEANEFSFGPLEEVAFIFVGIFATMTPALDLLQNHAGEIGFNSARSFYWGSGALSSVLDNAPTYLSFLAAAMGHPDLDIHSPDDVKLMSEQNDLQNYLVAVSLGSVFFGACTYIGNGPNMMVKSICEARGGDCPSFVGYILRFTLPILMPILLVVGFAFVS